MFETTLKERLLTGFSLMLAIWSLASSNPLVGRTCLFASLTFWILICTYHRGPARTRLLVGIAGFVLMVGIGFKILRPATRPMGTAISKVVRPDTNSSTISGSQVGVAVTGSNYGTQVITSYGPSSTTINQAPSPSFIRKAQITEDNYPTRAVAIPSGLQTMSNLELQHQVMAFSKQMEEYTNGFISDEQLFWSRREQLIKNLSTLNDEQKQKMLGPDTRAMQDGHLASFDHEIRENYLNIAVDYRQEILRRLGPELPRKPTERNLLIWDPFRYIFPFMALNTSAYLETLSKRLS